MTNIMKNAWTIAKSQANVQNYSSKKIFPNALRQSWREYKNKVVPIIVSCSPKYAKLSGHYTTITEDIYGENVNRDISNLGWDITNKPISFIRMNVVVNNLSPLAQWLAENWGEGTFKIIFDSSTRDENNYYRNHEVEETLSKLQNICDTVGINIEELLVEYKKDSRFNYGREKRGSGDWLLEHTNKSIAFTIAHSVEKYVEALRMKEMYNNTGSDQNTSFVIQQSREYPGNKNNINSPEMIVESLANAIRMLRTPMGKKPIRVEAMVTKWYQHSDAPKYILSEQDFETVTINQENETQNFSIFNPLGGYVSFKNV